MRTLRPSNAPARERMRIGVAFAASAALHLAAMLVFPHAPVASPPASPPPLTARLAPPPEPRQREPRPAAEAPPPVVKNTLDAPKAEVLEDPIKPQPRRRITEKPEPQPPKPARAPPDAPPDSSPKAPPKPPPVVKAPAPEKPVAEPPPVTPPTPATPPTVAAREEAPRRPLDLSIPADPRARSAERLSPQELNETLTRLSETMLYPSEALRRGLEGEVVIVVELGAEGRIVDAAIASGSGHAVLDDAAVRAVRRLGSLGPSTANRTILLPVRFRIL